MKRACPLMEVPFGRGRIGFTSRWRTRPTTDSDRFHRRAHASSQMIISLGPLPLFLSRVAYQCTLHMPDQRCTRQVGYALHFVQ